MALLSWQEARNLLVVDPANGLQIEHVKACDPDAGWLETWATYECADGHQSLWKKGDGSVEERPYMLLSMTDACTGRQEYMTRVHRRDFDLVDKRTGEVLREVRLPPREEEEASPEPSEPACARPERGNL
jgi:hypothetical protein